MVVIAGVVVGFLAGVWITIVIGPHGHWQAVVRRWVCWVLESQARTWIPLGLINIAALVNVVAQQGWGSAFLAIPTVVSFSLGVMWLRRRLRVVVKRRRHEDEVGGRKNTEGREINR
ncbi:hypothetical protein ACQP2K_03410 [Microbispora siamensis]